MTDDIDGNIDSQVDNAMKILGDPEEVDAPAEITPQNEGEAGDSVQGQPDETKSNEEVEVEPLAALEPPASWRSDEKELFRNLPREVQETSLRLQQAQDSHFTQRSTELAQKIRATDDERNQYQAERTRYASELQNLSKMAAQLLPAKFSDIQSEADYLRMKATDPARASEYEAFQQILQRTMRDAETVRQSQMNENLNREWAAFVGKYPEFQDSQKAQTMLQGVRKGVTEYYGFTPQEVQIIPDHRYIPVMRDALAWQQHQANIKAAAAKKLAPAQQRVIKPTANTASQGSDKSALLKRARASGRFNDQVDLINQYLSSQG